MHNTQDITPLLPPPPLLQLSYYQSSLRGAALFAVISSSRGHSCTPKRGKASARPPPECWGPVGTKMSRGRGTSNPRK